MAETIIELYRENVERLTEVRKLIDLLGAGAEDKDGPLKLQEAVLRARVDAMSKMFIGKENGILSADELKAAQNPEKPLSNADILREPALALPVLERAYGNLPQERKEQLDRLALETPGIGREATDADRKEYPYNREIEALRQKIMADTTLTTEQKDARRRALEGAEELTAIMNARFARENDARELALGSYKVAKDEEIRKRNQEKYQGRNLPAYQEKTSDFIIRDRAKHVDLPKSPPISQKYRATLVKMLRKMDDMDLLSRDSGVLADEEQAYKAYGFTRLESARTAFTKALKEGRDGDLPRLRQDFDRELENARELMEMAREGLGKKAEDVPGNLNLDRRSEVFPYEVLADPLAQSQVNGLYQLYVIMQRLGQRDPESFLDNLGENVVKLHKSLADKSSLESLLASRKDGKKDFDAALELLTTDSGELDAEQNLYDIDYKTYAFGMTMQRWIDVLANIAPEGENRAEIQNYVDNYAAIAKDLREREKKKVGMFIANPRDDFEKKMRDDAMIHLLLAADEDRDLDKMVGYPGLNDSLDLNDPFDLDGYLRTHTVDPEQLRRRIEKLETRISRFSKWKSAPKLDEVTELAFQACRKAYLTAELTPENEAAFQKLSEDLRARLPENSPERQRADREAERAPVDRLRSLGEKLAAAMQDKNDPLYARIQKLKTSLNSLADENSAALSSDKNAQDPEDLLSWYEGVKLSVTQLKNQASEDTRRYAGVLAVTGQLMTQLERNRQTVQNQAEALKPMPGRSELNRSKAELAEMTRALSKATEGVWGGSKQFDAMAEAVKALREQENQLPDGPVSGIELHRLRESYESAMTAARVYIEKKFADGKLNANGRMRLEAAQKVMEKLQTQYVSLETAENTLRGRLTASLDERAGFVKDLGYNSEDAQTVSSALERTKAVLTGQKPLSEEEKKTFERDFAIALAASVGSTGNILRQADSLPGLRRETGDLDLAVCERVLQMPPRSMEAFLTRAASAERQASVSETAKAARDTLRNSLKAGQDKENYKALLKEGKFLIAAAEGLDAGPGRLREIVENPGFQLSMSRLAADQKNWAKAFSGTPREVSGRLLVLANQGVKVSAMMDAAMRLQNTPKVKSVDDPHAVKALSDDLSYVMAVGRAAADMGGENGGRLLSPPTQRAVRAKQRELRESTDFKALVYIILSESNGPKLVADIFEDLRQGSTARAETLLERCSKTRNREDRANRYDEVIARASKQEEPEKAKGSNQRK